MQRKKTEVRGLENVSPSTGEQGEVHAKLGVLFGAKVTLLSPGARLPAQRGASAYSTCTTGTSPSGARSGSSRTVPSALALRV